MTAYHSHNLGLYCDNPKAIFVDYRPGVNHRDTQGMEKIILPPGTHYGGEFPMEFLAKDAAEAKAAAKKSGWYFFRDGSTLCPRCHLGGIKVKTKIWK